LVERLDERARGLELLTSRSVIQKSAHFVPFWSIPPYFQLRLIGRFCWKSFSDSFMLCSTPDTKAPVFPPVEAWPFQSITKFEPKQKSFVHSKYVSTSKFTFFCRTRFRCLRKICLICFVSLLLTYT
jgi:hypothetical protein